MTRYFGWSEAYLTKQLKASISKAKKNKYHAERVQVDGVWFDSKKEAARYSELRLMQKANLISSIEIHPIYPIYIKDVKVCDVELDFAYTEWETKVSHHEDVKGHDTQLSKLKRKMVEAYYGFKVELI